MTRLLKISVLGSALLALAAAGCGSGGAAPEPTRDVRRATAWINPTEGNQAGGSAIFIREGNRITLQVSLMSAPPGVHAVHLHEKGDCSAPDGSSAGAHWNPGSAAHGAWGHEPFHLGDIGNLTVGDDGKGSLTHSTDLWSMGSGSATDVLGKSVIVHAAPDDFQTQPTGAAGGRIACGVIKE